MVVEKVAIHNLQHHENLDIYKKCFYIMDKYFPEGKLPVLDDCHAYRS